MPAETRFLSVASPTWPPLRCGGQGRAIATNPASIWEISGWALLMWTLWKGGLRGGGKSRPSFVVSKRPDYQGGHCRIMKGKDYMVQTVLVWKQQRYCWCWSVCGGEVDREGIWGRAILRPDYPGEIHSRISRSASALSSVCLCPTVWSQWFCKGSILRPTLGLWLQWSQHRNSSSHVVIGMAM